MGRQGQLPLVGKTDLRVSREGRWGQIPSLVRAHACPEQAGSQSAVHQEEDAVSVTETLPGRMVETEKRAPRRSVI